MKYKLWDKTPLFDPAYGQEEPTLEPFLAPGSPGAVIVCAGGAYQMRCEYEAYPVAEMLQSYGVNAFILHYLVAPYKAPCALADLQRAIRFLRANAEEWQIDPEKIGAIGFSAGGHLVASGCTIKETGLESVDDIDRLPCHLNAGILCYPVITMGNGGHAGSRVALLGSDADAETIDKYSCEKHISDYTPPCFLYHTFEDAAVPALSNSGAFASAMKEAGRPCELHIFQHGIHGSAWDTGEAGQWRSLLKVWLENQHFTIK